MARPTSVAEGDADAWTLRGGAVLNETTFELEEEGDAPPEQPLHWSVVIK
jgi:hypothetical protein